MIKHDKEKINLAENAIRGYLKKGFTYHQAAKLVSQSYDIPLLTLRRKAYDMAIEEGYFHTKGIQHKSATTHGKLLLATEKKLKSMGWSVLLEQNEIRKIIENKGSQGNPDLIAQKNDEILLIEIVEPGKNSSTLVNQMERFKRVGKTIIIFPINIENIEFWGVQQIEEQE